MNYPVLMLAYALTAVRNVVSSISNICGLCFGIPAARSNDLGSLDTISNRVFFMCCYSVSYLVPVNGICFLLKDMKSSSVAKEILPLVLSLYLSNVSAQ